MGHITDANKPIAGKASTDAPGCDTTLRKSRKRQNRNHPQSEGCENPIHRGPRQTGRSRSAQNLHKSILPGGTSIQVEDEIRIDSRANKRCTAENQLCQSRTESVVFFTAGHALPGVDGYFQRSNPGPHQ